jgi:hypothetical protein
LREVSANENINAVDVENDEENTTHTTSDMWSLLDQDIEFSISIQSSNGTFLERFTDITCHFTFNDQPFLKTPSVHLIHSFTLPLLPSSPLLLASNSSLFLLSFHSFSILISSLHFLRHLIQGIRKGDVLVFEHKFQFEVLNTSEEFLLYLQRDALKIEVWGQLTSTALDSELREYRQLKDFTEEIYSLLATLKINEPDDHHHSNDEQFVCTTVKYEPFADPPVVFRFNRHHTIRRIVLSLLSPAQHHSTVTIIAYIVHHVSLSLSPPLSRYIYFILTFVLCSIFGGMFLYCRCQAAIGKFSCTNSSIINNVSAFDQQRMFSLKTLCVTPTTVEIEWDMNVIDVPALISLLSPFSQSSSSSYSKSIISFFSFILFGLRKFESVFADISLVKIESTVEHSVTAQKKK